ncbi:hypothetical protein H0I25_08520 [Cellulophaga sp. HaHa_2_95]|uniref:hypothetical protein n=1 Tax=unclassified Cellulophaga TaxID=2634405 RepID=UPI001C4ED469|nr:hypothetical protein [Cellulophaga sp. HaHa_2_95]QXP57808.1 hypothetical protein H0I25_08520 [Cellulophaga sp. HaHa_2_95]
MRNRIILGILAPLLFLSFAVKKDTIELVLKPKINEKLQYKIKRTTVGNKHYPKFGFKWYSEYKVEFILKSLDKDNNLNYDFRQLYFVKRDSSYNKGIEKFDTRKILSDEMSHFKPIRNEIKNNYQISLKNNGEIAKNWTLKNGLKPNSGVFYIDNFQMVFPEKEKIIGEKWEYESKGVFTKYHKSKSIFYIKEVDDKEICIGFKSYLITNDLMNNTEAYGEYILEKSTCNLIYAKIESEINGNTETLEIEKM